MVAASAVEKNGSSRSSGGRLSTAMERTDQRLFSQEIPTDVVVEVGEAKFSLHKLILVAKSNYIRKVIMDSEEHDLSRIDLSGTPGGAEIFDKAAKFCYGVNFEMTVEDVAALRCAAEYLQMTENCCHGNLGRRAEEFLLQVALTSLSGAVQVLKSCQHLLPLAEELNIVQRCVDAASLKACNEARFPSRSPPNWWVEELSNLDITFLGKIICGMRARGAEPLSIARTLFRYSERQLLVDVVYHGGADQPVSTPRDGTNMVGLSDSGGASSTLLITRSQQQQQQRKLLESIVDLLPSEAELKNIAAAAAEALSINNHLSRLLRSALLMRADSRRRMGLEKRMSAILDHVAVEDLLLLSFNNCSLGEELLDGLESVTRIISGFFVDRAKNTTATAAAACITTMQRVSKTVDAYLAEIAKAGQLITISMFNGIAILLPKGGREVDDDLYRAVDIFLKTHSSLDEIEREKVCSVMDPLRLSYQARVHASQNKRLPLQVVLHALYYDELTLRSGNIDENEDEDDDNDNDAAKIKSKPKPKRKQSNQLLQTDVTLIRENEALRSELARMKMFISDLQRSTPRPIDHHLATASAAASAHYKDRKAPTTRKPTFLSSVSKTLGKLNPFRHGSKDTSALVEDDSNVVIKPRRRRFSMS